MLAFESLTPEALLKEIAEWLRFQAVRSSTEVHILDRKARLTREQKTRRNREDAVDCNLRGLANELDAAAIVPAVSKLRKTPAVPPDNDLRTALAAMLKAYAWDADKTVEREGEQALHSAVRAARAALRNGPTASAQNTFTPQLNLPNVTAVANALAVVVLDHRIREWLEQHDPKAFEQAEAALTTYDPDYTGKLADARHIAEQNPAS